MSTNRRRTSCGLDEVFAVLADGWLLASWVVGACRIRSVDGSWPAVGSVIHHSVGAWPAVLDDTTTVLEVRDGRLLRLGARGWPLGEAEVVLELHPDGPGTWITMEERASRGPATLLPSSVLDIALHQRNREALRRLSLLAEGPARRPR